MVPFLNAAPFDIAPEIEVYFVWQILGKRPKQKGNRPTLLKIGLSVGIFQYNSATIEPTFVLPTRTGLPTQFLDFRPRVVYPTVMGPRGPRCGYSCGSNYPITIVGFISWES